MSNSKIYKSEIIIIGGGFYGCMIALYFKKRFKYVTILEKESDLLLKASYNNQARIHNGYHYPRSFITALRSHINYSKFISEFKNCVEDTFQMIYAIAANNSKTTTSQFLKFCHQIGSPISPTSTRIKKMFNSLLIEDSFIVEEAVFNAAKLRKILKNKLNSSKVKVEYLTEATKVAKEGKKIEVHLKNGRVISGDIVINCSYSDINSIIEKSGFPKLPLKHELTEMPLLEMPKELKKVGITIMDGPFFSIMPFPDKKLHTLHHVRYTPLTSSTEMINENVGSNALFMIKDAQRYLPILRDTKYKGSIYEIKTVLIFNELSDARPILFKRNYGIDNFFIVMGGKIDNVYDIISQLDRVI